jgi:hypothetical protein
VAHAAGAHAEDHYRSLSCQLRYHVHRKIACSEKCALLRKLSRSAACVQGFELASELCLQLGVVSLLI